MIAMTMKDDAFFALSPETENAEGKDGREHDRHEEVGQENRDDRDPAQLRENEQAKHNADRGVQPKHGVGGEFLQDTPTR